MRNGFVGLMAAALLPAMASSALAVYSLTVQDQTTAANRRSGGYAQVHLTQSGGWHGATKMHLQLNKGGANLHINVPIGEYLGANFPTLQPSTRYELYVFTTNPGGTKIAEGGVFFTTPAPPQGARYNVGAIEGATGRNLVSSGNDTNARNASKNRVLQGKYNTAFNAIVASFTGNHSTFVGNDFKVDQAVHHLAEQDWSYVTSHGWTTSDAIARNFLQTGPTSLNRRPAPDKSHPDVYGYYLGLVGRY